jgi:hypothetical protein
VTRYIAHTPSPASVADVYAFLADFTTLPQWDPGVAESRLVAGEPARVGARYRVVAVLAGVRTTLEYEVLTADAPSGAAPGRFEVRAENADVVSHDLIEVSSSEPGCTVTYTAVLQPKGIRRLAEPAFWALFQIIGRRAEAGLRRTLSELPTAAP